MSTIAPGADDLIDFCDNLYDHLDLEIFKRISISLQSFAVIEVVKLCRSLQCLSAIVAVLFGIVLDLSVLKGHTAPHSCTEFLTGKYMSNNKI